MANVFVEPRPKGRQEGTAIEDYVVEDHADHALATFKTQHEAIEWARKNGHSPHVSRVRHSNDKKLRPREKKDGHGSLLSISRRAATQPDALASEPS